MPNYFGGLKPVEYKSVRRELPLDLVAQVGNKIDQKVMTAKDASDKLATLAANLKSMPGDVSGRKVIDEQISNIEDQIEEISAGEYGFANQNVGNVIRGMAKDFASNKEANAAMSNYQRWMDYEQKKADILMKDPKAQFADISTDTGAFNTIDDEGNINYWSPNEVNMMDYGKEQLGIWKNVLKEGDIPKLNNIGISDYYNALVTKKGIGDEQVQSKLDNAFSNYSNSSAGRQELQVKSSKLMRENPELSESEAIAQARLDMKIGFAQTGASLIYTETDYKLYRKGNTFKNSNGSGGNPDDRPYTYQGKQAMDRIPTIKETKDIFDSEITGKLDPEHKFFVNHVKNLAVDMAYNFAKNSKRFQPYKDLIDTKEAFELAIEVSNNINTKYSNLPLEKRKEIVDGYYNQIEILKNTVPEAEVFNEVVDNMVISDNQKSKIKEDYSKLKGDKSKLTYINDFNYRFTKALRLAANIDSFKIVEEVYDRNLSDYAYSKFTFDKNRSNVTNWLKGVTSSNVSVYNPSDPDKEYSGKLTDFNAVGFMQTSEGTFITATDKDNQLVYIQAATGEGNSDSELLSAAVMSYTDDKEKVETAKALDLVNFEEEGKTIKPYVGNNRKKVVDGITVNEVEINGKVRYEISGEALNTTYPDLGGRSLPVNLFTLKTTIYEIYKYMNSIKKTQ